MKETPNTTKSILGQIGILLVIVFLCVVFNEWYAKWFVTSGFPLLQTLRCIVLDNVPFSWGDVVYFVLFIVIIRVAFTFFIKKQWCDKQERNLSFLKLFRFSLFVGILLYLLWSSLYAQPKLSEKFGLENAKIVTKEMLIRFDDSLICRLNFLAEKIDSLPLQKANETIAIEYKKFDSNFVLKAKPSLLGNGLAYFGIEGYFNPLTGEAQVNKNLPNFMLPFVVAHEMAHQTGISAEDDANLMAYIRSVQSKNVSFQYSAYFNIWLYTHRKVHQVDSLKANVLKSNLNSKSLAHLAILKQRNIQYYSFLNDWSSYVFDAFLKLGNQQEGISSYRGVAYSALLWEQQQHFKAQN